MTKALKNLKPNAISGFALITTFIKRG